MRVKGGARRAKKITAHTITYVCCALIAVFFVFPLVWMIVTSTKTELQYANDLGSFRTFLPYVKDLSTFFDNYARVLTQYDIWKYGLNSMGYALAVVAGEYLSQRARGIRDGEIQFSGQGIRQFSHHVFAYRARGNHHYPAVFHRA